MVGSSNLTNSRTVLTTLFLFFYIISFSQNKNRDYHRFQISASFDIYDKLKYTYVGEKIMQERFSPPSSKFVFGYSHYFKNTLGLNIGLALTAIPFRFYWKFPVKNPVTISGEEFPNPDYFTSYDHFIYSIPLSIEKRFLLKNKNYFSAQLGYEFNYILAYPYGIAFDAYDLFIAETTNSETQVINSIFFKIGFLKEFKRKNSLGLNFLFSYSPQLLGVGKYRFQNVPYNSSGTFEWNINHMGIELVYQFVPIHKKGDPDYTFKKKVGKYKFEWFPISEDD